MLILLSLSLGLHNKSRDCHAHLVSEASSVISSNEMRIIKCDSSAILNAILRSDLWPCVLNGAPSESTRWRFTTNHRTGFTDDMCVIIACDLSCSTSYIYSYHYWCE